ncbi:MAG: hypothetical protein CFE24_09645 [Flavobacterium sp. BFFFF2]|nr:MAG: hypothetical protein CFE24_09645 [Flavobacterium sp. BFFFF2]
MCTLTYLPKPDGFILTSSRDEFHLRNALPPKAYRHANGILYYPRDPEAGGTWFGWQPNGTALVLLNGAFEKHIRLIPYRRSRGLILLDLLNESDILAAWSCIDLDAVEPFTLIACFDNEMWQMVWDGAHKYTQSVPANEPHIWSSATLYDLAARAQRTSWFQQFMEKNSAPNPADLMDFHQTPHGDDPSIDLLMTRNKELKTLSITQLTFTTPHWHYSHEDLLEQTLHQQAYVVI